MITCDRCLSPDSDRVDIVVRKFDGRNRQGREIIRPTMELCDQCLTDLLKNLGQFKVQFLSEGDTPDKGTTQ